MSEYTDEIAELGDGGAVVIGEVDAEGFYLDGALVVSLDGVRAGVGLDHGEDISGKLSDDDVRKAVTLLTAYLELKYGQS